MNDLDKFLKSVEERLQGVEEKVKKKLDSIDAYVNKKLKEKGFGWSTDEDETENNSSEDFNNEPADFYGSEDEQSIDAENAESQHSMGSENNFSKKIEDIAPYLDDKTLHNMVYEFLYGDLEINMVGLLPFIGEDDISLIMKKLLKCEGETFKGLEIKDLLPFADEDDIDEVFIKRAKEGYIDREMMPFVSDKCWHEIVKEYCKDENSTLVIDEIYPYLADDDITLLFKTYLKRQKKHRRK